MRTMTPATMRALALAAAVAVVLLYLMNGRGPQLERDIAMIQGAAAPPQLPGARPVCAGSSWVIDAAPGYFRHLNCDEEGTLCVAVVIGTRPEAVKMAPMVHALRSKPKIKPIVVFVGQHVDLVLPILDLFDVRPDVNLLVTRALVPGMDLPCLQATVTDGMMSLIQQSRPDVILVQGDTTTAFAAAIAGFYSRVAIGHIEAGLRTHDMYSPYPEEFNRKNIDAFCSFHFAPTDYSMRALEQEGITRHEKDGSAALVTGNTVIDAVQWLNNRPLRNRDEEELRAAGLQIFTDAAMRQPDKRGAYIVVTSHRRENYLSGALNEICRAVLALAKRHPNLSFLYLVHPNPAVQKIVRSILSRDARAPSNVVLAPPVSYAPFVHLVRHSLVVLTDSGGIQEEASSFAVPVLVMRESTERYEGVQAGVTKLVGTGYDDIVRETEDAIQHANDADTKAHMARNKHTFGDGTASIQIRDLLLRQAAHLRAQRPPKEPGLPGDIVAREASELTLVSASKADRGPDVQRGPGEFDPCKQSMMRFPEFEPPRPDKRDISVILTVYQRTHTLEQLDLLSKQTWFHRIADIFVYQNEQHVNVTPALEQFRARQLGVPVHHIHSKDYNFPFFGRFAVISLVDTPYVALFDDDVRPQRKWLEHCFGAVDKYNAIVGSRGVYVAPGKSYYDAFSRPPVDAVVDFVGHAWCFRTEWIYYLWRQKPPAWSNSEDTALSAAAYIHGGIRTVVPNALDPETHGDVPSSAWRADSVASHKKNAASFRADRNGLIEAWRRQGWVVVRERQHNQ